MMFMSVSYFVYSVLDFIKKKQLEFGTKNFYNFYFSEIKTILFYSNKRHMERVCINFLVYFDHYINLWRKYSIVRVIIMFVSLFFSFLLRKNPRYQFSSHLIRYKLCCTAILEIT